MEKSARFKAIVRRMYFGIFLFALWGAAGADRIIARIHWLWLSPRRMHPNHQGKTMTGPSGKGARASRSAAATCALAIASILCFPDAAKAASFPSYAAANAYCLTVVGVLTGHGTFYGGCINYAPVPPSNTGVVRLKGSFGEYAFDYDTPANAPWSGKTAGPNCNCAGDPITLSTGNEFHAELDADLGALSLHRYYNSDMGTASANIGTNWRHSFDRSLSYTTQGGTSATLYRDNGRIVIFRLKDGAWAADADVQDKLVSTDLGWTYFDAATRQHETYNMSGYLTSIVDVNGLVTSMTYSTADTPTSVAPYANLLLTVTDANGRTLSFTYVPGLYAWSARLSAVTLPDGGVINYSYTDNSATQVSNLGQVTYPDGSRKTYSYTMNQGDTPWPNALTGVVDEKGILYTEISYDNQGRATGSHMAGGADATSVVYNIDGTTSVTYPSGVTTTLTFAVMNYDTRTTGVSSPCGAACRQPNTAATYDSTGHTASTTDFNGNIRNTTFDANGLLAEEIEASGTPAQRMTDTTWDASLRQPLMRTVKDNAGKLVSKQGWAYNAAGQTTARCLVDPVVAPSYTCTATGTAPTGVRRTTTTYCTAVNGSSCPLIGLPLTVDGPRTDVADTVSYAWYPTTDESGCGTIGGICHHLGDLKSTKDGAGLVTTYVSYDKAGRVTRVKDPNAVLTDFIYTPRGWLASKTIRASTAGAASSLDAVTTVAYDPTGTVHSVTDPDGVVTTYTYDAAHRLTDITDPSGNHVHYTLDVAGNRTASQVLSSTGTVVRSLGRTFNALGQLTAMTDGLNNTVFSAGFADSYDANGNLVHSQDGLGHHTKQAFDGLNRLVSTLQNYQGADTATANSQTANTFDALDRVNGFNDPDGLNTSYDIDALGNLAALHSPDTGTTARTFDVAGNALTSVDATNNSRARTYDADNRLLTETFADTSLNVQYKYDEADSITGCTGSFGRGHLTRVIEGNGGITWCYDYLGNVVGKQQTVGTITRTTVYSWTTGNRLASVTTPNGTLIAYTRNALGQIASIQATPSGGAATTVVSNVVHMPFGAVASYMLGDGQAVTLTYDANGAWTDVTSAAFSLHVKRDVVGNIVAIGNAAGVPTPTETYSYDPLYRLTGVNAADGTSIEAYTYNKTGDRLSKTAPGLLTGNYSYSTGTHHLTGVGTTTRVVDARGNTTADVLASGTYGYGYNGRNRLTVIQNGGVTVGSYVLNALGQRVQKTAAGISTRFDYDEDSHLLSESAGTTTRDYIWMDGMPVGLVDHTGSTTAVSFIHADALGSPRAVTSTTGSVLWQWAYAGNPFGEKSPVSFTGYTLNLRFPGQYFDAESDLSYNVNRDYEAATGRYIQSDPMGLDGGMNTYGYVDQNPFGFVDPLGLQAVCLACHNGVLPGFPGPIPMPPPAQSLPAPGAGSASDTGDGVGDVTKPDTCPPDRPCPPCRTVSGMVIPVGTIGYRLDILPDSVRQHGIYGSHYNLYKANQAPRNSARPCKCFWQPIGAVSASDPVFGSIPIENFAE